MNQLATTETRPLSVRQQIDNLKPEFAKTLPAHIQPDAFVRTVQTALQLNPDLQQANPRSLFASCMKAAADGLIIDGREAALIVRNVKIKDGGQERWEKHATYQPMVQGLMKLARNSGEIVSIIAHVVYENDTFSYVLGDDERIEHAPAPFTAERGKPVAAYAIVKLKDGSAIREVMRASEILNIGSQGTNGYQYDPAKGKNFAEWWRKTLIRRITKYIPRSSDAIGRFASAAEQIDSDYEFEGEAEVQQPEPVKKRGAAAAALKDITPAPADEPANDTRDPQDPGPTSPSDYDAETGEVADPERQAGDDI